MKLDATAVWFPKRVISRCPATIFAINRTASVRGRITLLIDSINTIKGINAAGVLCGTRWANICLVEFNHPNNINANQIGILNVKVSAICLDDVKIYGNSPIKLFTRINRKREINKIVLPLYEVGPNKVLNSLNNFILAWLIKILIFVGVLQ